MVIGDIKQQVATKLNSYIAPQYGFPQINEISEQIHALYEQHFIDKHCKAVRTQLLALTMRQIRDKPDCIVEVAEQAIRESKSIMEENHKFNLKNWQYCHKHGGIGFISDCVECKKRR